MSISPTWTVWCDAELPGCYHWCQATGDTVTVAKANAKHYGWKTVNPPPEKGIVQLNICPACYEAGAR